jgi:hypothetical protein
MGIGLAADRQPQRIRAKAPAQTSRQDGGNGRVGASFLEELSPGDFIHRALLV